MGDNEYGGGPDPVQEPEQVEGGGGGEMSDHYLSLTQVTTFLYRRGGLG